MSDTKPIPVHNNCNRFLAAFLVFCCCGVFGVLYDLDHVVVLWARKLPITLDNLAHRAGRPLHVPVMLVLSAACIVCGALLVGQAARASTE